MAQKKNARQEAFDLVGKLKSGVGGLIRQHPLYQIHEAVTSKAPQTSGGKFLQQNVVKPTQQYFDPTRAGTTPGNFWNTGAAQNLGRVQQALPTPYKKFSQGFGDATTFGLAKVPEQQSVGNGIGDTLLYGGGFLAGAVNPYNPVNKLGLLQKVGTLGSGLANRALTKYAPQALSQAASAGTKFLAQKALPVLASEAAQTAAYGGIKTAVGQEFNPLEDFGVGVGLRGIGKTVQKAFPNIQKEIKGINPKLFDLHPEDRDTLANIGETLLKKQPLSFEQNASLNRMFKHFFPGVNLDKTSNKKITDLISYALDVNAKIPKDVRAPFPGMKLVDDTVGDLRKHQIGAYTNVREVDNPLLKGKTSQTPILDEINKGFEGGRKIKKESRNQGFRTAFFDKLTPIHDLVKGSKVKLGAEENPYIKARLLAGTSGKVDAMVNEGLAPTLQREQKRLGDLSALLVLDRESELIGRGLQRKRNADQITQGIDELRAKYGDEGFQSLKQSADEIRGFGSKLLDSLKESGIIDDASYSKIKSNNELYVPLQAVEHLVDDLEKNTFLKSSFNVSGQDVIRRIGDYTDDVADPLESLLRKTSKVVALTEKNKALRSLVDLRNKDADTFKNLIIPIKDHAPEGMEKISLFENGQNVQYAVPKMIASAVKGLDQDTSNLLVKILSPQAKLLRAGATGLNIGFIPANIVRDFSDAVITEASERGLKGVGKFLLHYPQAIFSALRKDDLYQDWLKSGGGSSTMTEQVIKSTPKTVKELSGQRSLIKSIVKSPKSLVEFANRVGEQSTRLARYKSGISSGESKVQAAFKSRDISLDFAKSGNSIKVLNQVIPFLNAGIQGSEKLMRMYKNNPKQALTYSTVLFGTPTLALYKYNTQFQDYQDIPQAERNEYWIFITQDRTPEERDAGEPIHGMKVPKGFLARPISGSIESALNFAQNKDPQSLSSFFLDTAENLSPIGLPIDQERLGRTLSRVTPPLAQVGIEAVTNRDLFFNKPIVPRALEGVEPREQYTKNTSGLAKAIGNVTNTSPLHIENTVTNLTGGLGRQILQASSGDLEKATTGQITRRFTDIRSGENKDKEFDEIRKYQTEQATASLKRKREAEELYNSLIKLPKEEANRQALELKKTDKLLFDTLKTHIENERLGLSSSERAVRGLGVADGTRAKYLMEQFNRLTTREEKNAYYKELRRKKIITDDVKKQLAELIKKGELVTAQ